MSLKKTQLGFFGVINLSVYRSSHSVFLSFSPTGEPITNFFEEVVIGNRRKRSDLFAVSFDEMETKIKAMKEKK